MPTATPCLIAVDVGNSRIKIGRFDRPTKASWPEPNSVFDLPITDKAGAFDVARLGLWCDEHVPNGTEWLVASVCENAKQRLMDAIADWARRSQVRSPVRQLTYRDVPLEIRVEEPARVGMDRLLGALAAGRLRQRECPAIVIDLGTAITVDLVETDGSFAGGAILPGIATSARALREHTAALPHVAIETLQTPPTLPGKSTTAAIQAGLYWGAVGAIRELVAQMSAGLATSPDLFLTGGAAWQVAELLSGRNNGSVQHVPNLVLSGIALVAGEPEATT